MVKTLWHQRIDKKMGPTILYSFKEYISTIACHHQVIKI